MAVMKIDVYKRQEVDGGAQVFLVPAGQNYQDCKKMKKEENLEIKLISVKNIDDAIKKLKDLQEVLL